MGWFVGGSKKADSKPAVEEQPKKKKICCACPETKTARDECTATYGPESERCQELIEAHKLCLRAEGFDRALAPACGVGTMNRLTKAQKDRVVQFCNVTGAAQGVAAECLQATSWSLERAIDHFYAAGMQAFAERAGPKVDRDEIHKLYLHYKDPDIDAILADGVVQLCEDLGVSHEDVVMLVLSWHFKAETMCEFSQKEFEDGMASLGCDSMDKLRARLPALRAELGDQQKFRHIYNFAYLFSREKGQKCVQQDVALAVWQLLVPPARWPLMPDWCQFLAERHNRAISRDTWAQLLDFMQNVRPDFSNYDNAGAWPYLMDDFVEWQRSKAAGDSAAAMSD